MFPVGGLFRHSASFEKDGPALVAWLNTLTPVERGQVAQYYDLKAAFLTSDAVGAQGGILQAFQNLLDDFINKGPAILALIQSAMPIIKAIIAAFGGGVALGFKASVTDEQAAQIATLAEAVAVDQQTYDAANTALTTATAADTTASQGLKDATAAFQAAGNQSNTDITALSAYLTSILSPTPPAAKKSVAKK